jgi:hypothetical protein
VRIELTRKGFADLEVVPLRRLFSVSSLAIVVFYRNFVVPTRYWPRLRTLSSILDKLGASTRTEAVALGIRRGLIPI